MVVRVGVDYAAVNDDGGRERLKRDSAYGWLSARRLAEWDEDKARRSP